jgi:hypothetical protein
MSNIISMSEARLSLRKSPPEKKTAYNPRDFYRDVKVTVTFGPVTDRPGITIPTEHYRFDRY